MSACKMGDALAHLPPRMRGRVSRLVRQIVTALQLWCIYSSSDMDLYSSRGGCYDTRAAPGSGVCREARDGACVRHAEEVIDRKEGPTRVREAQTGCTAETSSTDHCANSKCDVTIGGKTYCSQCATGYVPIDGTCVEESGQDTKCTTNSQGACTQCGDGYFLHRGGCYKIGQAPGNAICTDTQASSTVGECTACAAGYFKNPTAAGAAVPPCIACNDTTGDATNNKKGLEGCATCETPTSEATATCTACADGYYGTTTGSGVTCSACTEPCATCTGAATQCTSCKDTNQYFKKGDDETGECVEKAGCKGSYFPNDNVDGKKQCISCGDSAHGGIADCKTCAFSQVSDQSTLTCSVCTPDTKKPNKEGSRCFVCSVDGCSNCSKDGVCETCSDGKKVSPGGSSCVPNCPDNSTDNKGACICNSGFAASGDGYVASSSGNLSTGAIAGMSVTKSSSGLCC
ncbi:Variant-specific surface protein [Giardia duodenalis]|uniref:Variant-specific surface protein n=1 Tax=Giardia intestinalis TaxID=5741 RepID=V6TZZ7_GIAIN|nr:Variant-specific surface protein [Giardia intestinalis]